MAEGNGEGKRRFMGLDGHTEYARVYELGEGPTSERHFRFPTSQQGWSRFIGQLDRDCWIALEITGNAFEVYDMLSPHAGKVVVANTLELRRLGSGRHTDKVDAARLAKMLALGILPTVWVPPVSVREMRRLLTYRERLVSERTRCLNQAKAVLRRAGLPVPKHGRFKGWVSGEQARSLPSADQVILTSALRMAKTLDEEVSAIEVEVASRAAAEPGVRLLMTITGVGLVAAATMWAAIGDPWRFPNGKKLARYAGLDPSVHQSGESHYTYHISKNGSQLLRSTLIEAAQVVARHDTGALRAFYLRKRGQIGHHKAIVALARKLLVVAWRMLLTGEPYRARRPELVSRKEGRIEKLLLARRDWDAAFEELFSPAMRGGRPRLIGERGASSGRGEPDAA